MEEQFKLGDLVQLKSGSPIMTVNKLADSGPSNVIECVWFDNTNAGPHYATFFGSTLIAEPLHFVDEE